MVAPVPGSPRCGGCSGCRTGSTSAARRRRRPRPADVDLLVPAGGRGRRRPGDVRHRRRRESPVLHVDSDAPLRDRRRHARHRRALGHLRQARPRRRPGRRRAADASAPSSSSTRTRPARVDPSFPDMWCAALSHCMERFEGVRPKYRQVRSGGAGAFTADNFPVFDHMRPNVYVAADSNHGYKMIAVGREIARGSRGEHSRCCTRSATSASRPATCTRSRTGPTPGAEPGVTLPRGSCVFRVGVRPRTAGFGVRPQHGGRAERLAVRAIDGWVADADAGRTLGTPRRRTVELPGPPAAFQEPTDSSRSSFIAISTVREPSVSRSRPVIVLDPRRRWRSVFGWTYSAARSTRPRPRWRRYSSSVRNSCERCWRRTRAAGAARRDGGRAGRAPGPGAAGTCTARAPRTRRRPASGGRPRRRARPAAPR